MTAHHLTHPPAAAEIPQKVTRHMVEELTGEEYQWDEKLDLMANYTPDLAPGDVSPQVRALADLCLVLLNSNEFAYVY